MLDIVLVASRHELWIKATDPNLITSGWLAFKYRIYMSAYEYNFIKMGAEISSFDKVNWNPWIDACKAFSKH